MDGILRMAALLATIGGGAAAPEPVPLHGSIARAAGPVAAMSTTTDPAARPAGVLAEDIAAHLPVRSGAAQAASDPWLSEDKFRHAAASWAAMVFTYAAMRTVTDDSDVAIGVALPLTASFGIAKEVVDRRHGGPFSFRDLAADALGAGAAWLFLREVR